MSAVRLRAEDKETLETIAEQSGMKQGVILGYLIDECVKYNMLASDWFEALSIRAVHEKMLEMDLDYAKKFELDKHKAILSTKQMLIKELLKTYDNELKRQFIEQALGRGKDSKGGNLLDHLTNMQMFSVNGQKKLYPPGADGLPLIVGIPPSQLMRCERGFHTKDTACLGCDMRFGCPIVREEEVNFLAVYGSKEEREKYVRRSSR